MKKFILAGVVLTSLNVFAEGMKVIQTSRAKDQVLFELNGNLIKAGDIVRVDGQCDVQVIQAGVLKGLVKTDVCRSRADINIGDSVTLIEAGDASASVATTSPATYQTTAATPYVPEKTYDTPLLKGFGVGAILGAVNVKSDYTIDYVNDAVIEESSETSGTEMAFGAAVNYSYIPRMSVGVIGKLNIFSTNSSEGSSPTYVRPELNVAFGAEELFYGYAGVNTYFLASGDTADTSKSDIGFQVGAGFLVSKHFNIDVSYAMMNRGVSSSLSNLTVNDQVNSYYYNGPAEIEAKVKASSINAVMTYQF